MRRILVPLTALALLGAACAGDEPDQTVTLEDGASGVELGNDDNDSTDDPDAETTDDAEPSTDDQADATDGTVEGATDGEANDDARDPWTTTPLVAEPGRWAVGDAGFVEFDLTDAGLALVEVTEADGWTSRVDDDSADEIEVKFRRDNVTRDIEIEWNGSRLEIDINTDIDGAEPGVYDIGNAGSFEFTQDTSGLTLADVVVADGWELRIDDESADEIELTLTNGDERWWVEIELDDRRVELEIDYRVAGDGR